MITPPPCPAPPLPSDAEPSSLSGPARLRELFEADRDGIIQTAVLLARRGDIGALRLCLERIAPRGVINLDIPKIESVADVPRIIAQLVELVASGRVAPSEADELSAVLNRYVSSVQATDHELRLRSIEKSIEDNRA